LRSFFAEPLFNGPAAETGLELFGLYIPAGDFQVVKQSPFLFTRGRRKKIIDNDILILKTLNFFAGKLDLFLQIAW
jgi:hypothetical protein